MMQKPSLDCRKTKSLPSFRLRPNKLLLHDMHADQCGCSKSTFNAISLCTQSFMSVFHPYTTLFHWQVARIAKQLKASQLRWIQNENHANQKLPDLHIINGVSRIILLNFDSLLFQVAAMAVPKASGSSPKWSHHWDAHDWRCDIAKEDLLKM